MSANSPRSQAAALNDEMEAALVVVCTATFAVEAIVNSLGVIVISPEERQKWQDSRRRPKASKRLRKTLRGAIADDALANRLADRWEPLILDRNAAVHFDVELRPLEMHPSGLTLTSADLVTYSLERAQAAVGLLGETLVAVRDIPQPATARWGAAQAHLIEELDR